MAIDGGYRTFDFGATRMQTPLADFKRRWGAEPIPRFHYRYPAARDAKAKGSRFGPRRRDLTILARAWDKAPLGLTRIGGAVVHRYL